MRLIARNTRYSSPHETPVRSKPFTGVDNRLSDLFPGSTHVYICGLDQGSDREVREYAEDNDLVIVTKDADYSDLSLLLGYPPKVIWIRRGNCSTAMIEKLLRDNHGNIREMAADPNSAMITIY